jgi:hypothetical protein
MMLFGLYLSYRRGMWVGILIIIIGWFIFVFGSLALIATVPAHAQIDPDGLIRTECLTQERVDAQECAYEAWRAEQRHPGASRREDTKHLEEELRRREN